jgi:CRP-like cAMP-binding protein
MGLASRDQWPEDSFVARLPEAERAALLAAGTHVRFDDDAILLLQGEIGECAYVLTSGLAKVIVAAESGAETTLAIRSRGDLMGEFALLDDKPRTATARAVGEVTALKIGGSAFMQLTSDSAAMQAAVTRYLLSKMRSTTERRAAERVWDAKERLAQVLYDLARLHALPGPDGAVRVPITQSELGELAGVAVSTTERVLKELRKQGVVTTRYREITIRDVPYLDSLRFP